MGVPLYETPEPEPEGIAALRKWLAKKPLVFPSVLSANDIKRLKIEIGWLKCRMDLVMKRLKRKAHRRKRVQFRWQSDLSKRITEASEFVKAGHTTMTSEAIFFWPVIKGLCAWLNPYEFKNPIDRDSDPLLDRIINDLEYYYNMNMPPRAYFRAYAAKCPFDGEPELRETEWEKVKLEIAWLRQNFEANVREVKQRSNRFLTALDWHKEFLDILDDVEGFVEDRGDEDFNTCESWHAIRVVAAWLNPKDFRHPIVPCDKSDGTIDLYEEIVTEFETWLD